MVLAFFRKTSIIEIDPDADAPLIRLRVNLFCECHITAMDAVIFYLILRRHCGRMAKREEKINRDTGDEGDKRDGVIIRRNQDIFQPFRSCACIYGMRSHQEHGTFHE
jgi:hypothetical protein